jgi:hypothetical protein
MKRLFSLLIFSVFLTGGPLLAQAQQTTAADSAQDDDEYSDDDILFAVLDATAVMNESCKGVLEPTYYDGFRVMLRVWYGELGATNDEVLEEEANAAKRAGYLCMDSAACWRSATRLPATATPEEGRQACMSQLTESFKALDEFLVPEAES